MNNDALDLLRKMHTVSIDLETTGIQPSDQIWSGGFYSVKDWAVLNQHQSFFDIKTPNSYSNLTSETDLVDILEKAHSSASFGAKQAGKGLTVDGKQTTNVLKDWAKAVTQGETSSVSSYVSNLNKELSTSKEGSILLLQNVNFEDRVLSSLYAKGGIDSFPSFTGNLLDKGLPASSDPRYGEPFQRYLLPKDIYDLRAKQTGDLRSTLEAFGKGSNIEGHLHQYYKSSMDIVDKYTANAARASAEGKVAVMDLMDFTKALYAHGAVSGQVKPEMLTFGSKVDTLARAILGTDEIHDALSDSKQQQEIFKEVTEELQAIRRNGVGYQSPLVDKLVKQMEKDKTFSTQLKERHISVAREYFETNSEINREGFNKALESRLSNSNRHLLGIVKEDFNLADFSKKFKGEADKFFDETGNLKGSAEELVDHLETFSKGYKVDSTDIVKQKLNANKLESILSHRATKWGAGAVAVGLGASMMFGGDREAQKEVKYNTYDEVYNNQYYGSAFADWQNRNNSHKMQ